MVRHSILAGLFLVMPILTSAEEPRYRLDPVNVTATRTLQTLDGTLASVTVIERVEIERAQALSVEDLLRGLAGITVSTSGGVGKTSYVFLRGAEPDHVLVLVDGIRVGSATTGTASIQDLPVDAVERIEVARGPCSSLYGSEAVGGVIQIFTRSGSGQVHPEGSAMGGTFGTYRGSVGLFGGDRVSFAGVVTRFRTDGFNAVRGSEGSPPSEPDDDGYRNTLISTRVQWSPNKTVATDAHYLRSQGATAYDGSFVNESDYAQEVLGGRLQLSPTPRHRLTAVLGRSQDLSSSSKDGVFQARFDTRRYAADVQGDVELTQANILSIGFGGQEDRVKSTTDYAATRRRLGGGFVQVQGRLARARVRGSLRRDATQGVSARTTGSVAVGYAVTNAVSVMTSYGSAFKTPTFNELYYPGFGNPRLRPESSANLEVGVSATSRFARASLSAYRNEVEDLIAYDAASQTAMNVERARIRGIESEVALAGGPWAARVSATLLDPEYRGPMSSTGNVLPLRARRVEQLDLDYALRRIGVGMTFLAEGERYDNLANTVRLPAYGLVTLRLAYDPATWCRAQLRVENLLDARYETIATYNQPRRNVALTLRVR